MSSKGRARAATIGVAASAVSVHASEKRVAAFGNSRVIGVRRCLWLNLQHGPFWQTLVSVFERRRLHWISLMSSLVAFQKFLDHINVRTRPAGA